MYVSGYGHPPVQLLLTTALQAEKCYPPIKVRKLRLREVKQVSPDHKAEWATELGSSNPELWEPSQKHLPHVELMFISGGL